MDDGVEEGMSNDPGDVLGGILMVVVGAVLWPVGTDYARSMSIILGICGIILFLHGNGIFDRRPR